MTPAILVALIVAFASVAQDEAETEAQSPGDAQELSRDDLEPLLRELAEQDLAELPQGPDPEQDKRDYSGEWIEEDGVRYCDGYLTRNADEEHCSSDVPEDWRPFEFDGETYYVAPLRNDEK